jgi:hypothetical protein
MNIRRGLFRLWILFACVFVGTIAAVFFNDVKHEFEFLAALVKNPPPVGYIVDHPPNPWGFLLNITAIALIVPAAVLGVGAALLWASSGFRGSKKNSN